MHKITYLHYEILALVIIIIIVFIFNDFIFILFRKTTNKNLSAQQ